MLKSCLFLFSLSVFSLMSAQLKAQELIWKRAPMLEQDLSRALSLKPEELCQELGQYSCLQDVHLYALGAHDPFGRVQYRSLPAPTQLTTIAFERVILNACIRRVAKDQQGQPEVFRFYPLDKKVQELRPAAVEEQIRELYRRFLVRDPDGTELKALASLADPEASAGESAVGLSQALCLAVGSQLEFLFF